MPSPQIRVRGTIEVRAEDSQGNLKQNCIVQNSLTRAALSQLLSMGLEKTIGLQKIFGTNKSFGTGQIITPLPGELGIYCLVSPVAVTPSTVFRPYLNSSQSSVLGAPTVSFCNSAPLSNGTTQDTPNGLRRVTSNCLLTVPNLAGVNIVSYSFEYRNPVAHTEWNYSGDVRSVIIGQSADQLQPPPLVC